MAVTLAFTGRGAFSKVTESSPFASNRLQTHHTVAASQRLVAATADTASPLAMQSRMDARLTTNMGLVWLVASRNRTSLSS
jgi:hypothetical protein